MVYTNEPPELNLDELQYAISDAAVIVARLSLDPNDGFVGSQEILRMIRPTISATRSMRPENITISGIKFALSNHIIRKTLQTIYNLKFERSRHNEDQFTHNDKKIYAYKVGIDISNKQKFSIRDAAMIAARLSHTPYDWYIGSQVVISKQETSIYFVYA
jgi:hypothetical protein